MAFKFKFKKVDEKKADNRMKQKGGAYDQYTKAEFPQWKPKDGSNRIRVVPDPKALETEEHYGKTIYLHYGIGADNSTYLSLKEHLKKPDPVAEERANASREGNDEYAKKLRPGTRVLLWIIDRKEPDKGVQLWAAPFTADQAILRAAKDEGGGLLHHYDPDEGYDIIFEKSGEGLKTKYESFKVARKSTPLSDEEDQQTEWLKYVTENPLEDTLQFYDYDHIADVFAGGKAADKKKKGDDEGDDGDDEPKTRKKTRVRLDDDDDKPAKKGKVDLDDDDGDDDEPKPKKGKKADPDDDDEDDDEPKAKKSSKKTSKDDDDEDDDEPKPKKSSKKSDPDDDDEDEPKAKGKKGKKPVDPDDDEDDDDVPPAKSSKSKKADPDDDEDDEDDDEPKSKKSSKKKSDPDDDDDDEDDEPKDKKSSKKTSKKSSKDDDDDDDD